ncbi:MAG TPA: NAD+ synthase [Solirubrobacteraceae bacterium]|nr:NAD+ synthase [Solirubrobacteraceae bacterium]
MAASLRIALAQIDTTVGDIPGNCAKIQEHIARARHQGAELVVFPELAVTGYPPEDLLLKEHFLRDARSAVQRLAAETKDIIALVGYPERAEDAYNAAAVLAEGKLYGSYRKTYLPNYGVFDEERYFQSGSRGALIEVGDVSIGLTVCEDIWEPGPPLSDEALAGATVIVNLSASPYYAGKGGERENMLKQRARDSLAAVAFCNLVGGQDELVFDGHSVVIDHDGTVIARAHQFREELLVATLDPEGSRASRLRDTRHRPAARRAKAEVDRLAALDRPAVAGGDEDEAPGGPVADLLDPVAEVYEALKLGLHDYVVKNGFRHVVLGLSGGIDSALVACLAVDALGPERVSVTVMPSPYSSSETQDDARALARNLGVDVIELPIGPAMEAYARALEGTFDGRDHDITEENLQARIRGNLLMALSNKFGWLVLTTGNKSELSVGYSTLYGDTAGGFAVIKDVPKTLVYALVRWRNEHGDHPVVPPSILERAPSAELRPDQRDDDSLPSYAVLDPILEGYVEEDMGRDQLVRAGYDRSDVERVVKLVDLAEYKRRQNPPGIKITTKSFGRDRRMPITNRYGG